MNIRTKPLMAYPMTLALSLAGLMRAMPTSTQTIVSHPIEVQHPGISDNKPQSYTLSQALDQDGHPTGYSMVVDSVVCTDGLCKVVKVTMTWDALGTTASNCSTVPMKAGLRIRR